MRRKALNPYYLLPAFVALVAFAWVAFGYPKGDPELWINRNAHVYTDRMFLYVTELGHGLFYTAVVICLMFVHVGYAAAVAFAGLVCSLVSNAMKRIFYAGSPRPPKFFEGMDLHHVAGSDVLYYNSFPSGHTMTAFAWTFLLAHLMRRKEWGLVLALLALAVGLSRVYLLKHFFVDVFSGGCIGLIIALLIYRFVFPVAEVWDFKLSWKWRR